METDNIRTTASGASQSAGMDTAEQRTNSTDLLQRYRKDKYVESLLRGGNSLKYQSRTVLDAAFGEILTTCEKIRWMLVYGESYLKPEHRP